MASNQGEVTPERVEGSVGEAIRNGRMLLQKDPRMALAQAQAILRRDRANVPALYLASSAHRVLGEGANARNAEAAALKLSGADPELRRIGDLLGNREFAQATKLIEMRRRAVPEDLVAMTFLAEIAISEGMPDIAEPLLEKVLSRAPNFRPAESLHMRMLLGLDRHVELRSLIEKFLQQQPDDLTALKLLSRVLSDLQDYEAAVELGRTIVRLEPKEAQNWVGFGEVLRFNGRKDEAREAFRRALEVNPDHGHAWWHLASIDAAMLTDEDLAEMKAALARGDAESESAGNLNFAIAVYLDKQGRYAEAYEYFAAGNALRHAAQPYDPLELTQKTTAHLERLPASAIPARTSAPENEKTPIFILGMPRAGSTLLERALGQHSQIEGMGELPLVPHMVKRLGREEAPIDKSIAGISPEQLAEFRSTYLDRASERMRTTGSHFIDKLHMNWKHLPLILRMLPSAIVIDIRRNAMDCCWSNQKTLFSRGHPAASDQKALAQFYRDYVRMCDTIRERAPERIHFLRYENLVEDFDGEMTRLFDHIGLEFEDACREFHKSTAPVATASSEQVREPLNKKGFGAAEPYRQWLGDLEAKLGELASA